ncbi:MAG: hypothetical protein B7733_20140 [Myxococcales bacterium FL481]|nr:MAG: hypothetical protein B7733_20140 [Myxococcales bacterium FL481]
MKSSTVCGPRYSPEPGWRCSRNYADPRRGDARRRRPTPRVCATPLRAREAPCPAIVRSQGALAPTRAACYHRRMSRTLTLMLALWCCLGTAAAKPQVLDRIVAVVNDDIILQSDLDASMLSDPVVAQALAALGPDAGPEAKAAKRRELADTALDSLVTDKLVLLEAERYQLTVSDDEIDMFLRNWARQNGMETVAELEQAVMASGEFASFAAYRAWQHHQILIYRTEDAVLQVAVSDAQVREHYRKMGRGEDARVDVLRWAIRPRDEGAAARDTAYASAKQLARRVTAGEDPAVIESETGLVPRSETIGRGQIAPALEDSLFAGRQGEVVGPLTAGQGFEVFKIVEHHASDLMPFDEAKENIRRQLHDEAFAKARSEWRTDLRARAHIDVRL